MAYPIVGAFYRPPAKAILQVLAGQCPLELRPEPENEHDSNAIAVWVHTSQIPQDEHDNLDVLARQYGFSLAEILREPAWHLGYIPRGQAAVLAEEGYEGGLGRLGFDVKGQPTVELTR